jgi:hypothetical protein
MINSVISFLMRKSSLLGIGGAFLILFGISLFNRYLGSDECWFGEQSYWLLHDGIVRMESMPGILGLSEHCYVYHKLFIFMGSAIIAVFGWSVTYFRIASLMFFLLFLSVFVFYMRNNKLLYNKKHIVLAVFLLVVNPMMAMKSFEFRPEIMMMALGFISFYALDNFKKHSKKMIWPIVGGLFAGMTFLTNMNGVAFCVAGFLFLLIAKEYKGLAVYTFTSLVVISLFFFDLLDEGAWQNFTYQLTNGVNNRINENVVGSSYGQFIINKIIRLGKEHERFFWSIKTMFFSALFFLALFSNFKKLKTKYGSMFLYLVLLILSNNIFGSHVAERYIVFYFPFMSLVITVFLIDIVKHKLMIIRALAIMLFVVQIGASFFFISKIISKNHDFVAEHEYVFEKIDSVDAKILGPWDLIYNGLEKHRLYSFKTYEYIDHINGNKMTQQQFLAKAHEFKIDFIVLPESMRYDELKSWFADWIIEDNPYYQEFYENEDFKILVKKQ